MITNELNIGLIEAAKEKMPTGTNLANTLMDILYIGKEAIYRRLRGEVYFGRSCRHLEKIGNIARQDDRCEFQQQCGI